MTCVWWDVKPYFTQSINFLLHRQRVLLLRFLYENNLFSHNLFWRRLNRFTLIAYWSEWMKQDSSTCAVTWKIAHLIYISRKTRLHHMHCTRVGRATTFLWSVDRSGGIMSVLNSSVSPCVPAKLIPYFNAAYALPSVLWHCWLDHLTCKNPSPIWPIMCLVGH